MIKSDNNYNNANCDNDNNHDENLIIMVILRSSAKFQQIVILDHCFHTFSSMSIFLCVHGKG